MGERTCFGEKSGEEDDERTSILFMFEGRLVRGSGTTNYLDYKKNHNEHSEAVSDVA